MWCDSPSTTSLPRLVDAFFFFFFAGASTAGVGAAVAADLGFLSGDGDAEVVAGVADWVARMAGAVEGRGAGRHGGGVAGQQCDAAGGAVNRVERRHGGGLKANMLGGRADCRDQGKEAGGKWAEAGAGYLGQTV